MTGAEMVAPGSGGSGSVLRASDSKLLGDHKPDVLPSAKPRDSVGESSESVTLAGEGKGGSRRSSPWLGIIARPAGTPMCGTTARMPRLGQMVKCSAGDCLSRNSCA